jgi:hypothetical protein
MTTITAIDPKKPIFQTRDIADVIGCSLQYVRDQVKAKKMPCSFQQRGSKYTTYRFSLNDVTAYNPDAAQRLRETFHAEQANETSEANKASGR